MDFTLKNFTESDCNLFLNKYLSGEKFELVSLAVSPISSDLSGYYGDHLVLKITVLIDEKEKDLRFFLKKLPTRHEVSIQFMKAANMFNKEINAYKFLEQVKKECVNFDGDCCPLYYFSVDDSYIILEELQAEGYSLCKNLKTAHMKLAIEALAKFHSATLIFEEIKSQKLKRAYRITEDFSEWLKEAVFVKDENYLGYKFVMSGINSLFSLVNFVPENQITADEFKAKIRKASQEMFEIFRPSKKFRNVWCNGNMWPNNVMYKYENELSVKCKIFDFQLSRYNPPASDLCELLYEAVDKDDREGHWKYYLDVYYDTLKGEIVKNGFNMDSILTREDFEVSCKVYLPYVMLFKSTFSIFDSVDKSFLHEVHTNSELYTKLVFDSRSEFLVNVMKSDEKFKNFAIDVLRDLRDQL